MTAMTTMTIFPLASFAIPHRSVVPPSPARYRSGRSFLLLTGKSVANQLTGGAEPAGNRGRRCG